MRAFSVYTSILLCSLSNLLLNEHDDDNIFAVVEQFVCTLYGYAKYGDVADCCADVQDYAAPIHTTITSVPQTVTGVLVLWLELNIR